MGLAPAVMVVIETDGSIEQVDSLKATYQGASGTGLHVSADSLDAALLLPRMVARQLGELALAAQCRNCPIHQVCGGGSTCTVIGTVADSPTRRSTARTSCVLSAISPRSSGWTGVQAGQGIVSAWRLDESASAPALLGGLRSARDRRWRAAAASSAPPLSTVSTSSC